MSQNSVEQSPATVTFSAESAPLLAVDVNEASDDAFSPLSAENCNRSSSKTPINPLSRELSDVEKLIVSAQPRLYGPVESVPKVSFILGKYC